MALEELGTVLVVAGHPDDETYLTAGIMTTCTHNGQRVACITATRGEEGSWDEDRWPTDRMGEIREAELMACLAILGIEEHYWLDYRDAACADVDPDEATAKIRAIMEDVRPDSVFTFGPDGMTDHPDHKAVSAWTTRAFEEVAPAGAKLYYATTTPEWSAEFVPMMNRFNVFAPGTPPVTPQEECAVRYVLPPDVMEAKLKAIECHVSQVEGMLNAFGQDFFRQAHREELFRLGAAR